MKERSNRHKISVSDTSKSPEHDKASSVQNPELQDRPVRESVPKRPPGRPRVIVDAENHGSNRRPPTKADLQDHIHRAIEELDDAYAPEANREELALERVLANRVEGKIEFVT